MQSWRRFLKTAIGVFAGLLCLAVVFVATMNPYGNLTPLMPIKHVIMDTNQRYQYPAIVRSGDFDSAVIGTSSSRLLKPERLEAAFGGSFANLGMDAGKAWEQAQLAKLFLKRVPEPRTLLFALDWVWCRANAAEDRITKRGWPHWIYDESPWNDWLYAINGKSVEIAGRQLAYRLGFGDVRFPFNGYEVFVPPEDQYDLKKARKHIWKGRVQQILPLKASYRASADEKQSWRFPALAWLDAILSDAPMATRKLVVFMPGHVVTQPAPGSQEEARIAACKAEVAAKAAAHKAHFVDFWIRSPITLRDENYWDPLHYRVPIADRIVGGIAAAVGDPTRPSDDYHTLATSLPYKASLRPLSGN